MWGSRKRQQRALAEVQARRSRSSTFTTPLERTPDLKAFLSDFYRHVYDGDRRSYYREELAKYPDSLELQYKLLVPDEVRYEDFWQRYEYRCNVDRVMEELKHDDSESVKKSVGGSMKNLTSFWLHKGGSKPKSEQSIAKGVQRHFIGMRAARSTSGAEQVSKPSKATTRGSSKLQDGLVGLEVTTQSMELVAQLQLSPMSAVSSMPVNAKAERSDRRNTEVKCVQVPILELETLDTTVDQHTKFNIEPKLSKFPADLIEDEPIASEARVVVGSPKLLAVGTMPTAKSGSGTEIVITKQQTVVKPFRVSSLLKRKHKNKDSLVELKTPKSQAAALDLSLIASQDSEPATPTPQLTPVSTNSADSEFSQDNFLLSNGAKDVETQGSSWATRLLRLTTVITVLVAAAVAVYVPMAFQNHLCGPVRPYTIINSSSPLSGNLEAPWWSPDGVKEEAFTVFCNSSERKRTSLQWTVRKNQVHIIVSDTQGNKLLNEKAVVSAEFLPDQISIQRKRNKEILLGIPWR